MDCTYIHSANGKVAKNGNDIVTGAFRIDIQGIIIVAIESEKIHRSNMMINKNNKSQQFYKV